MSDTQQTASNHYYPIIKPVSFKFSVLEVCVTIQTGFKSRWTFPQSLLDGPTTAWRAPAFWSQTAWAHPGPHYPHDFTRLAFPHLLCFPHPCTMRVRRRDHTAGLTLKSFQRPAHQADSWLASGNLDFGRAPTTIKLVRAGRSASTLC